MAWLTRQARRASRVAGCLPDDGRGRARFAVNWERSCCLWLPCFFNVTDYWKEEWPSSRCYTGCRNCCQDDSVEAINNTVCDNLTPSCRLVARHSSVWHRFQFGHWFDISTWSYVIPCPCSCKVQTDTNALLLPVYKDTRKQETAIIFELKPDQNEVKIR